jgi:hypothetical protein
MSGKKMARRSTMALAMAVGLTLTVTACGDGAGSGTATTTTTVADTSTGDSVPLVKNKPPNSQNITTQGGARR